MDVQKSKLDSHSTSRLHLYSHVMFDTSNSLEMFPRVRVDKREGMSNMQELVTYPISSN